MLKKCRRRNRLTWPLESWQVPRMQMRSQVWEAKKVEEGTEVPSIVIILIIDKTVLKDCRNRKINLSMAWIDYKGIHGITFVDYGMFGHDRGSMKTCIRRGIFQGAVSTAVCFGAVPFVNDSAEG